MPLAVEATRDAMMIRVFKHYVPIAFLVLGLADTLILLAAITAGVLVRYGVTEHGFGLPANFAPGGVTFTAVFFLAMFSLGLYQREYSRDLNTIFVRLVSSFGVALLALALIYYVVPDLKIWRSAFIIAVVLALALILGLRLVFLKVYDLSALKRRVLVIGAGRRAQRIAALDEDEQPRGFQVIGYLPLTERERLIADDRLVAGVNSLLDFALDRGIEEIIIAAEDRRGGLPIEALLACKLEGIAITDYSSFWERETGHVDLDALYPSWLVFSDGFSGGPVAMASKRSFDVLFSLVLLVLSLPMMALTVIAIRIESPGQVLYRQERVGRKGRPFTLLKFRSMQSDAENDGVPKWAAAGDSRITRCGAFIRRARIDELPQLFNVLKGDMSFVGPRPERPYFVKRLVENIPYYGERHRVKPGITGWAQLNYPYGASVEDAKAKLQYDLYYVKNYTLFLDFIIMLQTARVVFWPEDVR